MKKRDRREYYHRYREKTRQKIKAYKLDHGCNRCGYKKCAGALVFHHTGDNKKYQIARNLGCRSFETMKKEMDKCEVLCANCHAEGHYPDKKC